MTLPLSLHCGSRAAPTTLLGHILPDELPWSFLGRLRDRYPHISHERLADYVGTVPSYRKGFPTQVRSLAAALHYQGAPDLERIVLGHTFFPFALPEVSSADAQRLFTSMADETFPLAVPHSLKLPAEFRLRVCECCVLEDRKRYGFSYYHRMHQPKAVTKCSIHWQKGCLFETAVTAVTRDYLDPAAALDRSRQLDGGDIHVALSVVDAYAELARVGRDSCNRAQARMALIQLLEKDGYWDGAKVKSGFARRVRARLGQAVFNQYGLIEPTCLETWLSIPGLTVAFAASGFTFTKLLESARRIACSDQPPPSPPTQVQLEMFETVKAAAPGIIAELRADAARVSIWAIAKKIDRLTGRSFASNWSWRSPFRELLREQIHAAGC